jgi:hypothetical protein
VSFWTKEVLDITAAILSNHDSVAEAAKEVSEKFDRNITADAIRGAFLRNGVDNPSSFLKPVDEAPDAPPSIEANLKDKFPSMAHIFGENSKDNSLKQHSLSLSESGSVEDGLEWRVDFDTKSYVFNYSDTHVIVSFEQMELACYLYSKYPPGRGFTARETAGFLANLEGLEWIHEGFLRKMFKAVGFTHSMLPRAPHHGFSNTEEMIPSWYRKVDALTKADSNAQNLRLMRKMVDELQDELREVYEIHNLVGKANALKFQDFPVVEDDEKDNLVGAIFAFSDIHVGKIVKTNELTPLKNTYNVDVIKQRVSKMLHHIVKYATTACPDFVVAAWLGDLFEALLGNMRELMHLDMKEFASEQYDIGISIFKEVTDKLIELFDCPITVYLTGGNHDRLVQDRGARTELLLNHLMTEHVRALYKNQPRVKVVEGNVVSSVVLPNGVNYIFQHGHTGPLKPTSSEKDFINFVEIYGRPMCSRTLIHIGHWHNLCYRTYSRNGKVMFLPTMIGADSYATEHLHKSCPPEFAFIESTSKEDKLIGPFYLG